MPAMAHRQYTRTGPGKGKWVPNPIPCPVPGFGVVCTVKDILYKPIVPSPVPGPGPVQCE